jgi:hypothetical protein
MRWVVMVFDKEKRRLVEDQWFATEEEAKRYAKKLPAGTQWKILDY